MATSLSPLIGAFLLAVFSLGGCDRQPSTSDSRKADFPASECTLPSFHVPGENVVHGEGPNDHVGRATVYSGASATVCSKFFDASKSVAGVYCSVEQNPSIGMVGCPLIADCPAPVVGRATWVSLRDSVAGSRRQICGDFTNRTQTTIGAELWVKTAP
jgi:hypothetical protein